MYRNTHRGRIRTTVAVGDIIGETVCTVEVGLRLIGDRIIKVEGGRSVSGLRYAFNA